MEQKQGNMWKWSSFIIIIACQDNNKIEHRIELP